MLGSTPAAPAAHTGWELEVAKRIAMAAWMLHGLCFGGKPGQETLSSPAGATLHGKTQGFLPRLSPKTKPMSHPCSHYNAFSGWELEVAKRIAMAAWMLHGLCFGGKPGQETLCFFRVKWLRPAMKGTSCVRRVRLGSNQARLVPPLCSAMSCCSRVRSSMRFLTLWLQIAV